MPRLLEKSPFIKRSPLQETPTDIIRFDVMGGEHPSPSNIMEEHLSPSRELGLGRDAVRLALQEAMYALSSTPYDEADSEAYRTSALDEAREVLHTMTAVQADKMQQIILAQPESKWITDRIGMDKGDTGRGLIDRLSEKNAAGEYIIPDEVFQNFLEWHNHVLATRQRELDQRTEVLKDEYKQDIRRAVRDGWIPPVVLDRFDKLDNTLIYVDDGLGTTLRSARGHASGMVRDNYSVIVLAPSVLRQPRRTLRHEFDHVLDGQDKIEDNPPEHARRLRESHGLYRLFGGKEGGRAMNEALTEHIRSSLDNGSVDIIDPSHKKRKGAYKKERILLDVLVHAGVKKVDIRTFISAYFEDDVNVKGRESDTQELYSQLREAFPFTDVAREIHWLTDDTNLEEYAAKLRERSAEYKKRHKPHSLRRLIKKAA